MEVLYRLDLLLKMKIHLVYYIAILKLVYGNHKPLVYKQDIYKGHEENKQPVKKISKTVKEKMEKLIQLYRNLYKLVKLVQEYIKKYYN